LRNATDNPNSYISVGENSVLRIDNLILESNDNGGVPHWSSLLKVGIATVGTILIGHWVDLTKHPHPVKIVLNNHLVNVETSLLTMAIKMAEITADTDQSLVTGDGKLIYTAGGIATSGNGNITLPNIGLN
jgi:hypothetical protein